MQKVSNLCICKDDTFFSTISIEILIYTANAVYICQKAENSYLPFVVQM